MNDENTMHCEQAEMLLGTMAFGEVDEDSAEGRALRQHLDTCEKCREALGDIRVTAGLLTEAINSAPAPRLSDEKREKLASLPAPGAVTAPRRTRRALACRIAVSAAAAIVMAAGLWAVFVFPAIDGSRMAPYVAHSDEASDAEGISGSEYRYGWKSEAKRHEKASADTSAPASDDGRREENAVAHGGERGKEMVPLELDLPKPQFEGTPKSWARDRRADPRKETWSYAKNEKRRAPEKPAVPAGPAARPDEKPKPVTTLTPPGAVPADAGGDAGVVKTEPAGVGGGMGGGGLFRGEAAPAPAQPGNRDRGGKTVQMGTALRPSNTRALDEIADADTKTTSGESGKYWNRLAGDSAADALGIDLTLANGQAVFKVKRGGAVTAGNKPAETPRLDRYHDYDADGVASTANKDTRLKREGMDEVARPEQESRAGEGRTGYSVVAEDGTKPAVTGTAGGLPRIALGDKEGRAAETAGGERSVKSLGRRKDELMGFILDETGDAGPETKEEVQEALRLKEQTETHNRPDSRVEKTVTRGSEIRERSKGKKESEKEFSAGSEPEEQGVDQFASSRETRSEEDEARTSLSTADKKTLMADVLVSEGEELLKKNRPEAAAEKFQDAVKTAPGNTEAQRKLDIARQLVSGKEGGGISVELSRQKSNLRKDDNSETKPDDGAAALPPAAHFTALPVNPFVMTRRDRFSTFAIDVDTASYGLCRRYIRGGYLPPPGAVRVEEFVNAFDYNYPDRSDRTFTVHAEAGPSPFGRNLLLIKIGVKARTVGRENHRPAHLVFVIDTSGSMKRGDRLPLVKRSLAALAEKLSDRDRVSLVTYSDRARLICEAAPASDRAGVRRAVDAIQAGGATNMAAGLTVALQVARRNFVPGTVNTVILCSDGVANVGETAAENILRQVAVYRRHGITQNTVGFGAGAYNDTLMEQLANRGDGQYLFVDSDAASRRVFVKNLSAAIRTVARDAKIQVAFNEDVVRRYRLLGYENRDIADEDFRNDAVDAGEVGSGQHATALYEVELLDTRELAGARADIGTVYVRYRDDETGRVEEISRRLRRAMIEKRTPENAPRFYLAAAAAECAEILRRSPHAADGDLDAVRRVLRRVVGRLPLDAQAAELLELVKAAKGLPDAP